MTTCRFSSSVYASSLALVESLNSSVLSIGVTDSNAQVSEVAFPVPGNDDFLNSIMFFNTLISSVILRYKFRYILLWYSILYNDKEQTNLKKDEEISDFFITKKSFRKNYRKTSEINFYLNFDNMFLKYSEELNKKELKKKIRIFSILTGFFNYSKANTLITSIGEYKAKTYDQSRFYIWGKFFPTLKFKEDFGSNFWTWVASLKIRNFSPNILNEKEEVLFYNSKFFFWKELYYDLIPRELKKTWIGEFLTFSDSSSLKWMLEEEEKSKILFAKKRQKLVLEVLMDWEKFPFYTVLSKIARRIFLFTKKSQDYSKLSFFHHFSESKSYNYRFLFNLFEGNSFLQSNLANAPQIKKKNMIKIFNNYLNGLNDFYKEKSTKLYEVSQRFTEEALYFRTTHKGILGTIKDWNFEKLKIFWVYLADLSSYIYKKVLRSRRKPHLLFQGKRNRFRFSLMSLLKKKQYMLQAYHFIDLVNEMKRVENLKKKLNLKAGIKKKIDQGGFLIDFLYKSKKNQLYYFSWFNKKRNVVLKNMKRYSKRLLGLFFSKRLATLRSFIFNTLLKLGWRFKIRIKKSSYLAQVHPFFEKTLQKEAKLWTAFATYDISSSWHSKFKTLSYLEVEE